VLLPCECLFLSQLDMRQILQKNSTILTYAQ
jgi:hypothetical protein